MFLTYNISLFIVTSLVLLCQWIIMYEVVTLKVIRNKMNCSLSNVLWYCKSLFGINLHFTMVLKCSVNNRIPSILNFILYARLKLDYIHRRRGKSIGVIDDWCQRKHLYQFEFMTSFFILIIPLQNLVFAAKPTRWYLYN